MTRLAITVAVTLSCWQWLVGAPASQPASVPASVPASGPASRPALGPAITSPAVPAGPVEGPGAAFAPPPLPGAGAGPLIYSHTVEAGPDQSFLLVGEGLTADLRAWGVHPDDPRGREIKLKVQLAQSGWVVATVPERAYEGPIVVHARNAAGVSEPVVLNAPQPWWCSPQAATPAGTVTIFGRNLAQRPDFGRAWVYLARQGGGGRWLKVAQAGKYRLGVDLPPDLEAGDYRVWVHAGCGGSFGWGGPLALTVKPQPPPRPEATVRFEGGNLQQALDALASRGGGTLQLPEGTFDLSGTLVVPAGVMVAGAGKDRTVLVSPADPSIALVSVTGPAWNQGPSGVHTPGDEIVWRVAIPAEGVWQVWLRYATDMSPYKQPGVSGRMSLSAGGGKPASLENLPNTGSFGTFKWSRCTHLALGAGRHEVVWRNEQGGGIHIDAVVFARDPKYTPGENPLPETGPEVVVVQGEDVVRMTAKDGRLPGSDRAAAWLAGDGAGLSRLTLRGSVRTNLGVALRSPKYPQWVRSCALSEVKVVAHEGKNAENCGVRLYNAAEAVVTGCEIWGRAPLFLSGVQDCRLASNRLVSQTLWGGNSESYILGRNDVVRRCVIEDNVLACPPGCQAGGPTGRRMVWLSTGRGSVDLNYIANNREDNARFGGVAGTDQNVGEMILFEACQRLAYHGLAERADAGSLTLPARLPPTSDDCLGDVKRSSLAHDGEGNETPYWPPAMDQGTPEPVAGEYFATVLSGRGMGQTRRVARLEGRTYVLDSPWRVAPDAGSRVIVHTGYWRNLIVGNRTVDGMTGIQLWIGCIENVIADNVVERMRKPGLYLYGVCTTLASSMPCTWNRGIGPLYFNHIEGTRCQTTSCGALVIGGGMPHDSGQFPRCLGNVLRHNSFAASRTDGVLITGTRSARPDPLLPSILGTIVEFNVVRDAGIGYHVAQSSEATLIRRNHAYFWQPVNLQPPPRVGVQIDNEQATAVTELNDVEGIHGGPDGQAIPEQRGPRPVKK